VETYSNFFFGFFVIILLTLVAWFPKYGLLARWRIRRWIGQPQALKEAQKIIPNSGSPDPAVIPLGSLPPKTRAEIVFVDERCQGFARRRFLDLGLTPGTPIYPELENAFKDPRAYRVRGTLIALRGDQASWIWVRPAVEQVHLS
jgi:Fe2+ transport system protein FeoA